VRTTIEAMAAVLGGTQSLHTNSLDEAIALPTPFAARIARNTQLILADETGIPHVIDPLAGSYYVETLTASRVAEAQKLMDEVEALGGMTKAIESGMPKMRIEESSARRQARIDRGLETIVGVNKYKSKAEEAPIEILDVDNAKVRDSQITRLKQIRATRDESKCQGLLNALTEGAHKGEGNLLALTVDAVRARATVGEVADALEKVFSRYRIETRTISGVYGAVYSGDEGFAKIKADVDEFAASEGRRPRLLVAKMGQDDLGFDVDIGPLFQTPQETAREAIENDVHVVGVSSLAAGHKTLVPQLIAELKKQGGAQIQVICGGVIPVQDYEFLTKAGVAAIFGPGTNIPQCAAKVLDIIQAHAKQAAE
jgi:methylmalonyl-CoA mutase